MTTKHSLEVLTELQSSVVTMTQSILLEREKVQSLNVGVLRLTYLHLGTS